MALLSHGISQKVGAKATQTITNESEPKERALSLTPHDS
jgi:hypothetical protein